jgi:hypothetical protein
LDDFHESCQDFLFNDEFDPAHVSVTVVNQERQLLMTEEQKAFLKEQEKNISTHYNESTC